MQGHGGYLFDEEIRGVPVDEEKKRRRRVDWEKIGKLLDDWDTRRDSALRGVLWRECEQICRYVAKSEFGLDSNLIEDRLIIDRAQLRVMEELEAKAKGAGFRSANDCQRWVYKRAKHRLMDGWREATALQRGGIRTADKEGRIRSTRTRMEPIDEDRRGPAQVLPGHGSAWAQDGRRRLLARAGLLEVLGFRAAPFFDEAFSPRDVVAWMAYDWAIDTVGKSEALTRGETTGAEYQHTLEKAQALFVLDRLVLGHLPSEVYERLMAAVEASARHPKSAFKGTTQPGGDPVERASAAMKEALRAVRDEPDFEHVRVRVHRAFDPRWGHDGRRGRCDVLWNVSTSRRGPGSRKDAIAHGWPHRDILPPHSEAATERDAFVKSIVDGQADTMESFARAARRLRTWGDLGDSKGEPDQLVSAMGRAAMLERRCLMGTAELRWSTLCTLHRDFEREPTGSPRAPTTLPAGQIFAEASTDEQRSDRLAHRLIEWRSDLLSTMWTGDSDEHRVILWDSLMQGAFRTGEIADAPELLARLLFGTGEPTPEQVARRDRWIGLCEHWWTQARHSTGEPRPRGLALLAAVHERGLGGVVRPGFSRSDLEPIEQLADELADPGSVLGRRARKVLLDELLDCLRLLESGVLYTLPHALYLRVDELCASAEWLARVQGDGSEGVLMELASQLVEVAKDNASALWPDPAHRQRVAAVRLTLPYEPGYSARERDLLPGPLLAAPPRVGDPAHELWLALLEDRTGEEESLDLDPEQLVEWGIPLHFSLEAAAFRAADEEQPLHDLQPLTATLSIGRDASGGLWLVASVEEPLWYATLDGVPTDEWETADDGSQQLMLTAGHWELRAEGQERKPLTFTVHHEPDAAVKAER